MSTTTRATTTVTTATSTLSTTTGSGGTGINTTTEEMAQNSTLASTDDITPTSEPTSEPTGDDNSGQASSSFNVSFSTIYLICWIALISTAVLFGIVGCVDSKIVRYNEQFHISTIILFGVYTFDFYSDVTFVIQVWLDSITNNSKLFNSTTQISIAIIFILSILAIICPLLMNIYQLHKEIGIWMLNPDCSQIVGPWIKKRVKFLYTLSFICGSSFSAIELCNSHLFELAIFSAGLPNRMVWIFKNKRFFSVVLLENIPQIGCQLIYSILTDNFTSVTFIAALFSTLSALLTTIEYLTKSSLIKTESLIIVRFKLSDRSKTSFATKQEFQQKTKKRKDVEWEMGKILHVEPGHVELLRPIAVENGAMLTFYVTRDMEQETEIQHVSQRITRAIDNGTISKVLLLIYV